jgi:predicted Zn-dependent protease
MPPPPQLLMLVLLRRDWRYRTRIGVIIRRRGNEMALPKVVITFETKDVPPDWVAEMQKGVAAWNESPCLDTKLVQSCQPKTNCVTVSVAPESAVRGDGNFNAVESGGFTVRGHIDYSSSLTDGAKTNVAIHEMGHAVGLAHRKTEHVLMNGDTYDDVFYPDQIDFENLLVLYGNQK